MKINIPGAQEGMYMSTDSLMTDVRPISVQGDYALEARGLWRIRVTSWAVRSYRMYVWTRPISVLSYLKYLFIHLIK